MKTYHALALSGILAMGLGCDSVHNSKNNISKIESPMGKSFGHIPAFSNAGPKYLNVGCANAAGDFNKDDNLDYISVGHLPGEEIARAYLFLGNGRGGFSKPVPVADIPKCYSSSVSITAGDFNRDGNLDFIMSAIIPGAEEIHSYLFLGDGKGNFTQR